VSPKLTMLPGSARRTHRIITEARRLGLGNIRIERTNTSPRLAAEFNGEPISVALALMVSDRGDPARGLLQFHQATAHNLVPETVTMSNRQTVARANAHHVHPRPPLRA
jgi:hypothetical protein